MEKKTDNMKKMETALDKIRDVIEKFNDKLDTMYVDELFCEMIEDMKKDTKEKLTKKQRKEKALNLMKEKFPKITKVFEGVEILAEGIEARVKLIQDKFEDIEQEMSEIEDLQEEVERRKNDLGSY